MPWILFSILAALTWAFVGIIDKLILTKLVKKPIVPVMILGVVGLIASIFVYFINGYASLSYVHIILALVAGFFSMAATLLYFHAVKREEISRVVPLWYLAPIFVSVLAAFFLGEIFTIETYLGVFLLVAGAVLISSRKSTRISTAFWFMLFASITISIHQVLIKYLLDFTDMWTVFSYVRIGSFLSVVPLFYFVFDDLKEAIGKKGKKVVFTIAFNESLNLLGILFFIAALSIGFVTLVSALESLLPFFVLVITILLSVFFPKILKEEISKGIVLQKVIAIALMFVGVVLVT